LNAFYPEYKIDFLVRKGNEQLLDEHPFLNSVLVWEKKNSKYKNLFKLISQIRSSKYELVINLHRFMASGFITIRSGAKQRIGYEKNPLSMFYTEKYEHEIGNGTHEVERNQLLIEKITDNKAALPKLYPSKVNYDKFEGLKLMQEYIVIAPSSVWFTKQVPKQKVIELINKQSKDLQVCLIGAPSDYDYCQSILEEVTHNNVINLARELKLLDSAVLIEKAKMNYVNDSAPMHIASAMNASVTAFFCSTVPNFGFGPLSDDSSIIESEIDLQCRPCGLHGYKSCPEKHFKCGVDLKV
jgi:heptosyltransferase-2